MHCSLCMECSRAVHCPYAVNSYYHEQVHKQLFTTYCSTVQQLYHAFDCLQQVQDCRCSPLVLRRVGSLSRAQHVSIGTLYVRKYNGKPCYYYYLLYSNWCWDGKAAESCCLLPGCRLGNSQCFQVAIAVHLALVSC
jgi:hypothetical protein